MPDKVGLTDEGMLFIAVPETFFFKKKIYFNPVIMTSRKV